MERVGHEDAGVQKLCGAVDHLLKRGGTGSAAEQLVIICAAAGGGICHEKTSFTEYDKLNISRPDHKVNDVLLRHKVTLR